MNIGNEHMNIRKIKYKLYEDLHYIHVNKYWASETDKRQGHTAQPMPQTLPQLYTDRVLVVQRLSRKVSSGEMAGRLLDLNFI